MASAVTKKDKTVTQDRRSALYFTTPTTISGGGTVTLMDSIDVSMYSKLTVQLLNTDATDATVKVYGSIKDDPSGSSGGTDWVQIGDDITLDGGVIKAVSTTPLRFLHIVGSGDTAVVTCFVYAEQV
tara:strand:- start:3 stop:383 length:381 start_codon:yes stop_codon:yes gene_type:complete